MSLPLRPILSALLRNRTGAVLVAIQIAIALAVLVNAVYIVKQRVDKIGRPTGMDDANIVVVSSSGFAEGFDYVAALHDDLAYIRGVSGVTAATAANSVPLSGGGSSQTLGTDPNARPGAGENGNYYEIDEQGVAALGLRVIAGRSFRADEVAPALTVTTATHFTPQVMLSKEMATALFPNQNAVGQTIYNPFHYPSKVIGIIDHIQSAWLENPHPYNVFLLPRLPFSFSGTVYYLVRTQPGQRDAVARSLEEHLSKSNPKRLIDWVRPLQRFKDRGYAADRNMGIFLVAVTTLLLGISSLGIFGLATFNVSTRTKQIGTRRAIGARRRDILRYFMIENAMITTTGILVGCGMALAVGYWLSLQYQLPRLDLYYLAGGIPVLWVIGQLAVWQPARKASAVSPSVATRTV